MTMISMRYLSKMMMRHVTVKVILPHDVMHPVRTPAMPWKTLYFLPGITASADKTVNTINLENMAMAHGFAVVIPDGENSFYIDQEERNAFYGRYVAEELVEVTRSLFPLSGQYEDTWIGGISMGGFGALMQGCRHSQTFSKIAAFSPACHVYDMVDQGVLPEKMINNLFKSRENYMENFDPYTLLVRLKAEGKRIPELFLCCGTEDPLTYRVDTELVRKLQQAEIPVVYKEHTGVHDSAYWNQALPDAVRFLIGDETLQPSETAKKECE